MRTVYCSCFCLRERERNQTDFQRVCVVIGVGYPCRFTAVVFTKQRIHSRCGQWSPKRKTANTQPTSRQMGACLILNIDAIMLTAAEDATPYWAILINIGFVTFPLRSNHVSSRIVLRIGATNLLLFQAAVSPLMAPLNMALC